MLSRASKSSGDIAEEGALLGAVVSVFIAACRTVTGRQVYGDRAL
jgi:hypothetical protein